MPNQMRSAIQAGVAGMCSIFLIFFGIFLCFVGFILTVVAYTKENSEPDWVKNDPWFQQHKTTDPFDGMKVAGPVVLSIGVLMVVVAVILCVVLVKKTNQATTSTGRTGGVVHCGTTVMTSQQYPASNPYGPPQQGYGQQQPYGGQQYGANPAPYGAPAPTQYGAAPAPAPYPQYGGQQPAYPPSGGADPSAPPPAYSDVAYGQQGSNPYPTK